MFGSVTCFRIGDQWNLSVQSMTRLPSVCRSKLWWALPMRASRNWQPGVCALILRFWMRTKADISVTTIRCVRQPFYVRDNNHEASQGTSELTGRRFCLAAAGQQSDCSRRRNHRRQHTHEGPHTSLSVPILFQGITDML